MVGSACPSENGSVLYTNNYEAGMEWMAGVLSKKIMRQYTELKPLQIGEKAIVVDGVMKGHTGIINVEWKE